MEKNISKLNMFDVEFSLFYNDSFLYSTHAMDDIKQ